MAKTETNVSTLKINRGTYDKIQENLSSITENELIITSDKNVPIPTTSDNGKAVVVNASGEYELGNAGMSQSDADARYLQLSGGQMTGAIKNSGNKVLLDYDTQTSTMILGNSYSGAEIRTDSGLNIKHVQANTIYDMLDSGNTQANPTLSGGEATLSSLKLNGTNYAVGGTPLHTYAENSNYTGTLYTQIKDDITNKRDMIISGRYYRYAETENTIYHNYVSIAYDGAGKYVTYYYLTITDNTTSMAVGSSNTITNYQDYNLSGDQANLLYAMQLGQRGFNFVGRQIAFSTTAPTADNTSGYLGIVKLTSEPAQRFNGWWYIILSQSNASNDIGGSNGGTR